MRVRRWTMGAIATVLVLAGCGSSAPARTPRLTVIPRSGLVDLPRAITISDLAPGEAVTLSARMAAEGADWSSAARYVADGHGQVRLDSAAPTSGSYRGPSAMGPFWSATFRRVDPGAVKSTGVTVLTATTGLGRSSSVTVTQSFRGPGVTAHRETVREQGFVGRYFTPAHRARGGPAVIMWGGSEGGDASTVPVAELLASHGIPTLAIAYFDAPGLPCSLSDLRLEYFVRAIRWLRSRPGIDRGRVWGWSVSRGTEALGLVAAHWPDLLHGLVDVSASSVANGSFPGTCQAASPVAWTLGGRAVPYEEFGTAGLAGAVTRPAPIDYGRFRGSVLLVSGSADGIWPSNHFEDVIARELRRDPSAHVHLNYLTAGHADLGPPYTPVRRRLDDHGTTVDLGGTTAGNEQARQDDWPATLRFLTRH